MKQDEEMNQDDGSQDDVRALMGGFDAAVPFSQAAPFSARSSARLLTPLKVRPVVSSVWHQDAVHGHARVSDQLRPFCCSSPMLRLKRLKQLGVCAEVWTLPIRMNLRSRSALASLSSHNSCALPDS